MSTASTRGRATTVVGVGPLRIPLPTGDIAVSKPRLVAVVVVTLALLWLVLTHSLVGYLATVSPKAALRLNSSHPAALLKVAEEELNELIAEGVIEGEGESAGELSALNRAARDASAPAAAPGVVRQGSSTKGNPRAAEQATPDSSARRAAVRAMIVRALDREPLNAKGVRLLAQLHELEGDAAAASKLMYTAARLSIRESAAVRWVLLDRLKQRDYAAAVDYVDILLRTSPSSGRLAMAAIGEIAAQPDGLKPLVSRLGADPPWRERVMRSLTSVISDARTPLNILLALQKTPSPPTGEDLAPYLDFLVARGFHELAYYTWLQFLPQRELSRVGLLNNGAFDRRPSGVPFDWVVPKATARDAAIGIGYSISLGERRSADGRRSLNVDLGGGRIDFRGPSQILLLAPGKYRIAGEVNAEVRGQRGFRWRLVCLPPPSSQRGERERAAAAAIVTAATARQPQTNPKIGESDMVVGVTAGWAEFEFEAIVPEAGCRAQVLRLEFDARSTSERSVSGRIRYDNLVITRLEYDPAPSIP